MERTNTVLIPRLILLFSIFSAIFFPSLYDSILTTTYTHLYHSTFYNFSFIETVEVLLVYAIIEPIYTYRFAHNPKLRLDIRQNGDRKSATNSAKPKLPRLRRPSRRLLEGAQSLFPLLILDLVMVKKYAGVPVAEIRQSGGYVSFPAAHDRIRGTFLSPTLHNFSLRSPLQLHRALPADVPSSRRIVLELMIAFFIYDALFFFIHFAFHKLPPLRQLHLPHHSHAEINPQITNQLSIPERLSLILLANFSLNIIGSHVLTRTLFVPFFVYLLVEVHCGLDLEWGYEKILPFGFGAGSRLHAVHHRVGEGHYEPFFCWWDRGLVVLERWLNGTPLYQGAR